MVGGNFAKGIIAGFAATVVLSALMLIKSAMGLMPELNVIAMLIRIMGASSPIVEWAAHLMIGAIIWERHLPGLRRIFSASIIGSKGLSSASAPGF